MLTWQPRRSGPEVSALGFGVEGSSANLGPATDKRKTSPPQSQLGPSELQEIDQALAQIPLQGARLDEGLPMSAIKTKEKTMSNWTEQELAMVGSAEEVRISSLRADGTLSRPVIVWIVRDGEALYVRSVRGRNSGWFRRAQVRKEGQLKAGALTLNVRYVEETSDDLNTAIDGAYAKKYQRYAASIIKSINSPEARATTLRVEKAPL